MPRKTERGPDMNGVLINHVIATVLWPQAERNRPQAYVLEG
jgi:hypothetical protein